VPRKEPKILDSATFHCMSSFRRNYNNRLLKLAQRNDYIIYEKIYGYATEFRKNEREDWIQNDDKKRS
jgi:hypothetical protein